MSTLCGANCDGCSFSENCLGCEKTCGKPFGGECVAAEYIKLCGADAYKQFKSELLAEVNALLRLNELPEANALYELPGSVVNLPYMLPCGERVKLLDKTKVYLGTQIELDDELCCGVAADSTFILISCYKTGGKDAEMIVYQKR